jgi:hypothetical protein
MAIVKRHGRADRAGRRRAADCALRLLRPREYFLRSCERPRTHGRRRISPLRRASVVGLAGGGANLFPRQPRSHCQSGRGLRPLSRPDRRSCAGNAPGERIRGCAGWRRHASEHCSYHHESERGYDQACRLVSHNDAPGRAGHSAASAARRAGSSARNSFSYRRRAIFRDDSQSR